MLGPQYPSIPSFLALNYHQSPITLLPHPLQHPLPIPLPPRLLLLPLMAAVVSNSEQLAHWLLPDDEAPETHIQQNERQPVDPSTPPQPSMLDHMRATIRICLAEKARLCDRMTNLRLWQSSFMTPSCRARRGLASPYDCGASEDSASAAINLLSAQIHDMRTVIKMDQDARAAKLRKGGPISIKI